MFWQTWSPYSRLLLFFVNLFKLLIIGCVVHCNFCISFGVGLANLMICTSVLLCTYTIDTMNGF